MKAKYFTAAALTIAALGASAEVITPEQALQRYSRSATMRKVGGTLQSPRLVKTFEADNQPVVYQLRDASNHNLLLSADDQAAPLLAYFTSNSEGLNPAAEAWVNELGKQIAEQRRRGGSLRITTAKDGHPVEPMLTTKWNQDTPFNDDCPSFTNSSGQQARCPSGCVPTAMAQVINYHQYPIHGVGQRTYKVSTLDNIELSYDFENATFDYANMLDSYRNVQYSTEQGAAVANLTYACGVAANSYYGKYSTGTGYDMIAPALIDYFGYSKQTRFIKRMYFTLEQWTQMIYDEVAAGRPVLMSGGNSTGAHEFIADGYDGEGLFHINWGWGGTSDGYYAITGLDPADQGIGSSEGGYNIDQSAVIGVAPPVEDEEIKPLMTCMFNWGPEPQTCTRGYQKLELNFAVNASIDGAWQNMCGETQKLTVGSKFTDTTTGAVFYAWRYAASTFTPNFYNTTDLKLNVSKQSAYIGLPLGTYKSTPCIKTESGEIYDAIVAVGYRQYVYLTISNTEVIIEAPEAPNVYPTADNLQVLTSLYSGKEAKFTADVTAGSYEYFANVTAKLVNATDDSQVYTIGSSFMSISPGDTSQFAWSGNLPAVDAGEYNLCLYDNAGRVLLSEPASINAAPEGATEAHITNLRIENAHVQGSGSMDDPSKVKDRMLRVSYTVNCTSGYFTDRIICQVQEGYTAKHTVMAPQCYVDANNSSDHTVLIDASTIEPDTTYRVVLKQRKISSSGVQTDVPMTGGSHNFQLVTVPDDSTGLADLSDQSDKSDACYDLQGRKVTSPRHGLYIQGGKVVRL